MANSQVPAGTRVMLALSAANRDPRRWENPQALVLDRPKIKEHLAFGRGAHVCAGAPLARAEVRIILEKFLEHTSHIDLVEEKHGPRNNRNFDYEASFIIRGLSELHIELTPAAGAVTAEKTAVAQDAAKPRTGIFDFGKRAESKTAAATRYSTADTKIGSLLADPAAKAVLDKYFPGVSSDKRIGMAKGMTLRAVQKFAPDKFTTEALDAADAELAQSLPVRGMVRGVWCSAMVSSRRRGVENSAVRSALIDAAELLIREGGYPSVTARNLADKINLKRQIVHYYFHSMDDLFIAVIRRGADKARPRLEAALTSDEPLRALWEINSDPAAGDADLGVECARKPPSRRTGGGQAVRGRVP